MEILVVGAGYVGLVSATCFAEMGHQVTCLDIDTHKIETLKKGNVPFYEPGLDELVKRNMKNKRLFFTTDYQLGVERSVIAFIAVATPQAEDESAELKYVYQAASQIADHMNRPYIIVNKSTVPVGTASRIESIIQNRLDQLDKQISFCVASNPEFLKEGSAVYDFMKPDRIIVGADDPRAVGALQEIYSSFSINHDKMLIMDIFSAEISKYAANAMLASRISFMNEIAGICEKVGADVGRVRKAIGADRRLGTHFLYPGVGYGGSCFPKDIKAFRTTAQQFGCSTEMLDAIESVNQKQKQLMPQKIHQYFEGNLEDKVIAVWGLSFKPDTDDMRQAPALTLIKLLCEHGVHFRLYDPIAMENAKLYLKGFDEQISWCSSELDACAGADAIVLMTEWRQFRFVEFNEVLSTMNGKAFFDGRNQYEPNDMAQKGFDYICIGKKSVYANQTSVPATSR